MIDRQRESGVAAAALISLSVALSACRCDTPQAVVVEDLDAGAPPWNVTPELAPRRTGMVWIPAGEFIAGTPPDRLPRVADEEMPGVKIKLGGFFIDRFNHPDEPGALPLAGVSQNEARRICAEQDKRLCTELEWERACKGPSSSVYEYGDSYDSTACGTGPSEPVAPNGINVRCVSGFDVRDMHGSAANWTASPWGRGSTKGWATVRGGSGLDGELIGRCANARAYPPNSSPENVGIRCCAGDLNQVEVELKVSRGKVLVWQQDDAQLVEPFRSLIPDEVKQKLSSKVYALPFRLQRYWVWRPIGNEKLFIGGGCGRLPDHDVCGVMVVRIPAKGKGKPKLLKFVSSDWWQPTLGRYGTARKLSLYGGDHNGAYRKPIIYEWGRIAEGEKQRKKNGVYVP